MSVTLVHPTKAVGRNEMSFGRDTREAPLTLYYTDPCPFTGRGDWGSESPRDQSVVANSKHLY